MSKPIATFSVDYLQYINQDNVATQPLPEFATPAALQELYYYMSLLRAMDTKAINLQRTGQMSTYPASGGQEAVSVAIGHAMAKDDVLCPYYRDHGAFIQRQIAIHEIYRYWGGDERGSAFQHNTEDLPICVPIAGQFLHAAGVAAAIRYRHQARAVVATGGEGSTSKGDFYEAMNLAGTWRLPVVFVINNNQWAISVPRHQQTACQTFAQKAIAAGFKGIQVDGNDVIAVREAVDQALIKARQGKGPTLIEAVNYRLCDHTTADDATRYQPDSQVQAAKAAEPIARLAAYLTAQSLWSPAQETQMQADINALLTQEVDTYLTTPARLPESMFDHLYATLPDAYLDQRDELGEQA